MEIKNSKPNLTHKDGCYYFGLIDTGTCQGYCDEKGRISQVCEKCIFHISNKEK